MVKTITVLALAAMAASPALAQQQMQGMDHSKMQGMNHDNMPGMNTEASRVFRRRFHLSYATISRVSLAA